MKIKKKFTHSRGIPVWRVLINTADVLLIEERDTNKKEVFYQAFQLNTGRQLLKNYRPEDSFWIGVEEFRDDHVYFHRFRKPDMPWHKDIIAFSVREQKVIWENTDLAYGFMAENVLYAYKQTFDGAQFFGINPANGEIVQEFKENDPEIVVKRQIAEAEKDYSAYLFPTFLQKGTQPEYDGIAATITDTFEGDPEYITYGDTLLLTLHKKNKKGILQQSLYAIDLLSKKVYFEELIHSNEQVLQFDSFFVYRDFLVVIRDKSDVFIYQLV